jgi:hypothetical protein
MIRVVHPESRIRILTYPSRIQGSKKHRIRIRNTASRCFHSAANVPPRLTTDTFYSARETPSDSFHNLFLEKFLLLILLAFLFLRLILLIFLLFK